MLSFRVYNLDRHERFGILKVGCGSSSSGTSRAHFYQCDLPITGVAKHTVLRLLKDIGCACAEYHEKNVRNLVVRRVQCDEIWSFVYAKQKNVSEEQMNAGAGDCWTWTAIDADTKLIIS